MGLIYHEKPLKTNIILHLAHAAFTIFGFYLDNEQRNKT